MKQLAKHHHPLMHQGCVNVNALLFSVPTRLTNVSRDQSVLEGSNMTLFCEATGRPTPNITWTRVFEDYRNSKILHQGSAWVFVNISRTASGTYRCTADNGFGNPVSQVFRVDVTCKYFACLIIKLMSVCFSCVCPVIKHKFRHNIINVAVNPYTTLTML